MLVKIRKTAILITAILSIIIICLIGGAGSAATTAGSGTDMMVASARMYAYGSVGLDGASIAVYKQGDIINVRRFTDGVYCILGETGVKGYCSPIDLVEPSSQIYHMAPYKWSTDENGYVMISDMIDLSLYVYENNTSLDVESSDVVLLQRKTIAKLEDAVGLFPLNYTLRVTQGYLPSSEDPGYEVDSNTGCIVIIRVYYRGVEQSISLLPFVSSAMAEAGFTQCEGYNDVFYDSDFDSFFGYDLDMTNLPVYIVG
ncbi:MAG: hypothetical protein J5850_00860 [Clostridia bacterium]|nr:hypothetical protein [Clostridia bacterium]